VHADPDIGQAMDMSTNPTFILALLLGASGLACWTFVRFPSLAPGGSRGTLVHLVLAGLAANVALPFALGAIGPVESRVSALAIVAVVLPALTYLMLASMWLLLLARQMLSGYNR
jgi:hypothetical protein